MSEKRRWNEKNKKTAVITGLFALMFVVGVANYALSKEEKLPAEETLAETAESMTLEEDAFEVFKNERAISRQQQLSYIESVCESTETDEEMKKEAQEMKLALAANMEKELMTEGLIKTKLSLDSVVSVGDDMANIVIKKTDLSNDEVTQIADIVISETGLDSQNIKIMSSLG
ncbi:MAG: SpoIIIAH-like family protein [Christensenellaceae bacterium]|nr:SpoIIIAH-like family protein [Christensenellaceae bacterium]